MPPETMLRVYFRQYWYALSDPMAEETLYDRGGLFSLHHHNVGTLYEFSTGF